MSGTGAVILAAGGSTRLGEPKQMLVHHGQTLVRRAALVALDAGCAPVCIVIGDPRIAAAVAGLKMQIVGNAQWSRGIGTSIRCGVEACEIADPNLAAVAILVCDQPDMDARLITTLRKAITESSRGIAAAGYSGTVGVPAIFSRHYFPKLRALPDDRGAKLLLQSHADDIVAVPFPGGALDIDTPADLHHLKP
jgi:molybdenum cofactor cytidylyltransferase